MEIQSHIEGSMLVITIDNERTEIPLYLVKGYPYDDEELEDTRPETG